MLHTALRQVDYNVKPFTKTLISDTFEVFCTRFAHVVRAITLQHACLFLNSWLVISKLYTIAFSQETARCTSLINPGLCS